MISLVEIKRDCYIYQGSVYVGEDTVFFLTTIRNNNIVDLIATRVNPLGVIVVSDNCTLQEVTDKVYNKLNIGPRQMVAVVPEY